MTQRTNEDVIRKLAATYPPEEIISAALVGIALAMPTIDPHKAADLALGALEALLEADPHRFFKATHTEQ